MVSKQLSKFDGINRTIWNVKLCMDLSGGTLRCRYNATNIPYSSNHYSLHLVRDSDSPVSGRRVDLLT